MKKLLLLSFIYSASLFAQNEHWQQFSNGSINQIQQHGDTIWTLTVSGLYAWDRNSNERFEFNKKNCNIDFMKADKMLVDNSGNVWINLKQPPTYNDTNHYYLAKYDGIQWIKYTLQDLNPEARFGIGNIVQSNDEKIFFKISRGFMTYYQNQFSIDTVPGFYTWTDWTDEILTIAVDKLNHVWLGAMAGYFMFDGTFHDYALPGFLPWFTNPGEPRGRVDVISFDCNNVMWLGSADNCNGAQGFYKVEDGITTRVNYERVNHISVDQNNNKWIISSKGIQVYNDISWTQFSFLDSCIFFNEIFIDDKNNKFIGTYFGDEFIFDNQSWTVTSFRNSSLRNFSFNCITVDSHDNYYFIGQSLPQICKYEGTNWQVIPVPTNRINQPEHYDHMCIDRNNHIWLSHGIDGIYYYDSQGWKLFNRANSPIQSFDHLRISCDDQNRIWIVSPSDKIVYCYHNGNWTTYNIGQIVSDAIYLRELETGPKGVVWLSLINSRFQFRILKFDGNNWEIIYKTGLEIVKMKYSNVYGLILATMNSNVYPPYTCIKQINGTAVTNISQLCSFGSISDTLDIQKGTIIDIFTEDSTLWFLTDKMLTKFNNNNVFQYNVNNSDLNNDRFWCGAKDSKGNIVIGGQKTINILYRNVIPNIINEDYLTGKDIDLFPNPSVNGIIEIKSNEQFHSYKIYDMKGVLLSENKLKSTEKYIDINNLSSGLYFIQLIGKEGIFSIKHIVQ